MNLNRFLYKLLFLFLILLLAQCGLYLVIPQEYPSIVTELSQELKSHNDIVGFGDSSVYFYAKEDKVKKSIFLMLSEFYPHSKINEFDSPAYHLNFYEHMLEFIIAENKNVKVLIIPINMRSFSPQWDMNPGYEFEEEILAMKYFNNWIFRIFYKPLAVFKLFLPKISDHDYNNAIVYNGEKIEGRVKEFLSSSYDDWHSKKYMKDKFIFHYMYSLKKKHRKIISLLKINTIAKKNNIKVVFYVTPIDFEFGNIVIGSDFQKRIVENVSVLTEIANSEGFDMLDLSCALSTNYFTWRSDPAGDYSPNEHLTDKGRLFVARKFKEQIGFQFDGGL